MTGHNRLENYIDNLEALLRKNRSRTALSSITPPAVEPVTPVPSATTAMAQKSLRKFSVPVVANGHRRQRGWQKIWTPHQADHDGASKLILRVA
jgi:hypothetical protein